MGGAELAAMNQAALDRQKELSELGTGLLGMYEQQLATQAAEQAAATTGPMLPTLESLNVNVADGISPEEADLVFNVLDKEFATPKKLLIIMALPQMR